MRVKLNQPKPIAAPALEKPKSDKPKGEKPRAPVVPIDARDGNGTAKPGDAPRAQEARGGVAQTSAVHARLKRDGGEPIRNDKQPATPETHPQLFWHGKRKWKAPPPQVDVVINADNGDGRGWIEKWRAPGKGGVPNPDGKWVHNYTLEEMQRKAGEKFVKNAGFARNLGELRLGLAKDLRLGVDDKRGRTALAVAIIDRTYIRVGNEGSTRRSSEDADKQDTYGITTMLGGHLAIEAGRATFTFVGKSEVAHQKVVDDPRLVKMLAALKARGKDDESLFAGVSAGDVNDWLEPFGGTAKSFRTYHATRMATDAFRAWAQQHPNVSEQERATIVDAVVAEVAERLGHSPAVCKQSYIDPAVVALFLRGKIS